MSKVLITGGSGHIGRKLTTVLERNGHTVYWLSRTPENQRQSSYYWNLDKMEMDSDAILHTDIIIHLAGNGILDQRWTKRYKQEIIDSRIKGLQLLHQHIKLTGNKSIHLISGSGINYYGTITTDQIFKESDSSGEDFVSLVCQRWEDAAKQIQNDICILNIIRIGVVIGDSLPAISKSTPLIKAYIGSALGNGSHFFPWIHIDDICSLLLHLIQHKTSGVFNACSSQHTRQIEFVKTQAKQLNRKIILPPAPAFLLHLILGERSNILTKGSRISNEKIKATGFKFEYDNLTTALKEIY